MQYNFTFAFLNSKLCSSCSIVGKHHLIIYLKITFKTILSYLNQYFEARHGVHTSAPMRTYICMNVCMFVYIYI